MAAILPIWVKFLKMTQSFIYRYFNFLTNDWFDLDFSPISSKYFWDFLDFLMIPLYNFLSTHNKIKI